MAWIKIPAENHPIFHAALPLDPRVSTLKMFGGVAAMANGYMMGGLFGRSALVRLSDEDQKEALVLDGAEPFDPMGKGTPMKDTIFLPETIMDEPAELASWLRRALAYTITLPPKKKAVAKAAKPAKATKPAKSVKPAKATKPVKAAKAAKPAKAAKAQPGKTQRGKEAKGAKKKKGR